MSARPSARPSVCHTPVYSVETAKHIIKRFFSTSDTQTILVLPYTAGWQFSDEYPCLTRASNAIWNDDFRPISRFISEMMQDSYYRIKLSNDTSLNDLEWPLTQISRSRYYSTSNNSKRYKIELYLQWRTNRKSYMVYRTAPFSVTLNNQFSISRYYLTLNILFKDTTIVTMQLQDE